MISAKNAENAEIESCRKYRIRLGLAHAQQSARFPMFDDKVLGAQPLGSSSTWFLMSDLAQ